MSVIYNTSQTESTLKKKFKHIYYHAMREAVAMGKVLTTHVRSENNPSDIFTEVMPGGSKRDNCNRNVLYKTT